MKKVNYIYKAKVISVYDGDTLRVNVDLGFGIENKGNTGKGMTLRLFGINAPEMRGKEKEQGKISRDWLRKKILGEEIIIETIKDKTGKYGRYLANIYLKNSDIKINDLMVKEGLAVYKEY